MVLKRLDEGEGETERVRKDKPLEVVGGRPGAGPEAWKGKKQAKARGRRGRRSGL